MNEHKQLIREEHPSENTVGNSLRHLAKVFILYFSLGTVVSIWVYFSGMNIFEPFWMGLTTVVTAVLTTIIYWYTKHKNFHIEAISLVLALVLSILGIGVTDYSPAQSYHYWSAMILILSVAGITIGWVRADQLSRPMGEILVTQIVHWVATAIAVMGVLLLLKSGRLTFEGTGLVLLILLGLATFLDGCRVSWYFASIGGLMFITAIAAAYIEQYLWVLLVAGLGIAIVVFFWERHKRIKSPIEGINSKV